MSLLSKMRQPISADHERKAIYIPSAVSTDNIREVKPIRPFFFTGAKSIVVRSFIDDNGIIWFVARDFLKILDYPEWAWQEPTVRRYFTTVPSNYGKLHNIQYSRLRAEPSKEGFESLYCVNERGIRMFLDHIWQPAIKHILSLIDNDIVPFFHKISVTKEFLWNGLMVRTTADNDSKVWFVLRDVLQALQYSKGAIQNLNIICQDIKDSQKGPRSIATTGRAIEMFCLREDGLYSFLDHSKKMQSQEFREWIAEEVIPSWQRRGTYEEPVFPQRPVKVVGDSSAMTLWNKISHEPPSDDPKREAYKQAVALRAAREETGGVNRPMWLVVDRTVTFDQLVIMIQSYWLDEDINRQRISTWMKQHGYFETAYRGSNVPTVYAKQKGLFIPYTYTQVNEETDEVHLKADVNVTDVGVEFFTTLCVQGEQFEIC